MYCSGSFQTGTFFPFLYYYVTELAPRMLLDIILNCTSFQHWFIGFSPTLHKHLTCNAIIERIPHGNFECQHFLSQASSNWLTVFMKLPGTDFCPLLQCACIFICSLYILFLIKLLKLFPCGLSLWPQQFQIRQPPNVQSHYTEPLRGDGHEKIYGQKTTINNLMLLCLLTKPLCSFAKV